MSQGRHLPDQQLLRQFPPSAGRKALLGVVVAGLAVTGGVLIFRATVPPPARAEPEGAPPAPQAEAPFVPAPPEALKTSAPAKPTAPAAAAQAQAVPVEDHIPQHLVKELVNLSRTSSVLGAEQAERFKAALADLVQQGPASVPAIQELLAKNLDFPYANLSGGEQLGYSSLRAALIDALKQIGGPEAQAALAQTLQTTAVPQELLAVSKALDQQAPGQYRDEFRTAALDTLAMASANQLGTNTELGPAFRMLQNYGDVARGGIADAAKSDPQNFYNAVTLANLADGAGLPGLVQMAENPSPTAAGKAIATIMIAQLAGQNPDAFDALMDLARNGRISNGVWVQLAPVLAGAQYQSGVPTGQNVPALAQDSAVQGYAIVNAATTPDQIAQRLDLIEQCLGVVQENSAAANALRQQRQLLAAKLGR